MLQKNKCITLHNICVFVLSAVDFLKIEYICIRNVLRDLCVTSLAMKISD